MSAPVHQHFFNVRLDMMVDGLHNSVYEVNTVADAPGPENPHHNAFRSEATLLRSESEAQRCSHSSCKPDSQSESFSRAESNSKPHTGKRRKSELGCPGQCRSTETS
mgnify:CR=1 FL=1